MTQKKRYWIVKDESTPSSCHPIEAYQNENVHTESDARLASLETDEEKRIHNLKDREICLYDDIEGDEIT